MPPQEREEFSNQLYATLKTLLDKNINGDVDGSEIAALLKEYIKLYEYQENQMESKLSKNLKEIEISNLLKTITETFCILKKR